MVYTLFSLTPDGRAVIDIFHELEDAIDEALSYWPEDEFDMTIKDQSGWVVAHLTHGADPAVCTITFADDAIPTRRYRIAYRAGADGRTEAYIERLDLFDTPAA